MSCHTLRVWERRYGFPTTHRTPSGHRRYGEADVQKLLEVVEQVRRGESVGDVIAQLLGQGPSPPAPTEDARCDRAGPGDWLAKLLKGCLHEAEARYDELARDLSPAERATTLIGPALVEVGESWFRGDCQIAQERNASCWLRRKLHVLIDQAQGQNLQPTRKALVGSIQGDRHEGGVLIVALLLELAGCRSLIMGVDLPVEEYQKAIDLWRPDLVVISFVLSRNIQKRFRELGRLRGAPIFIGGRSVLNYRGLARRWGLTPLVGPACEAVAHMLATLDRDQGPGAHPQAASSST